jgi:hypothetical protein
MPSSIATEFFLFAERMLQLIFGYQAFFDQQVAEPDFLGKGH